MAQARVQALALFCLVAVFASSVSAKYTPPKHGGGAVAGNYTGGGLRFNYYQRSCPQAESLVTAAVKAAYAADNSIIAGLIRLFFHDCFVRVIFSSLLIRDHSE